MKWVAELFEGIKREGSEINHSPTYNATVKNEWSYNFTPPTRIYNEEIRECVMILEINRYLVSTPTIQREDKFYVHRYNCTF